MQSTGIFRLVDKMGRVVIPKEIRDRFNIVSDVDSLEFFMEGDMIVLRKYKPACFFCDTLTETISFNGYNVCAKCIEKMEVLKQEIE